MVHTNPSSVSIYQIDDQLKIYIDKNKFNAKTLNFFFFYMSTQEEMV